ncbi:heat shock protein Hsp20 [Ameyamaea chiangmaiensis NBRC 103196]|uniref:Hsp20 family protein n=1 Tax=Ameyamaea chiangmaiensis TaxID=442969 RepID=A0A850PCX7_9PROT|nr:Hsp20 family protein [Ameyamaea chiangmaiensis]MBS4073772.1 Hsp20 family protein [Ameyamaea chiangmaiensis]NVN40499.1 Hsp20 family protein [Ameyamaea chiangmaiensis]GBQ68511.1 heat shock protein Hsp20 [Ameyamaea chiangmaiensis NBRC 103196]
MTYDFAPLFRTAIGFDRLARLVDNAVQTPGNAASYPPYNIEKTGESTYALTMAVAGFAPDDIELTVSDSTLTVVGRATEREPRGEMLHRGIASRTFERRFMLADHIVIDAAALNNGLLRVDVRHIVPEASRPRRIDITVGGASVVKQHGQPSTPITTDGQAIVSDAQAA